MRKRTRRKVYPLVNPITYAIEGARVSSARDLDQIRLSELAAIDCLTRGVAGEQEHYDIMGMTTICRVMAGRNIGPEALDACDRADQHLALDRARFAATGVMGTTGEGLRAYRDVFAFHDLQRQCIARSEYESAIVEAMRVINFGKKEASC